MCQPRGPLHWVDGVKPITSLIWYGFAFDFVFALKALVSFLKVALIPLILGGLTLRERYDSSREGKPGRMLKEPGVRPRHQAAKAKSKEGLVSWFSATPTYW